MVSVRKVRTIYLITGRQQDYLELTVAPNPLQPLTSLAMNITFAYSLAVADVKAS